MLFFVSEQPCPKHKICRRSICCRSIGRQNLGFRVPLGVRTNLEDMKSAFHNKYQNQLLCQRQKSAKSNNFYISYLMLFGVTMPLKYVFDMPLPNYIVGMAHGFLFVAYVFGVLVIRNQFGTSLRINLILLLASFNYL